MNVMKTLSVRGAGAVLAVLLAAASGAQAPRELPPVEPPPRDFATAEAHYAFLFEQAGSGTEHTMATIPVWGGLWSSGNNTMADIFLEGGSRRSGGAIKDGVLTPPYEEHFKARRAEMEEYGQQRFDRLTRCEHAGVPRWLWEPYIKEFVNMPQQSWFMNDFMDETRRIHIGKEHVNIEAAHTPTGDSIGFWDGDKLVIWTKWVQPADYVRGMPLTSNQFRMVETWRQVVHDDGARELVTQVTFYDPLALVKPQSAVYTHDSRPDLEEAGVRIRNWECANSSNSYLDEDGNTQFYLPGDPGYKDPRGFTDFPELPGQSLDPIFDSAE
ncbi:hypothetical protein [Candidatus Rariloculus sp.]|uniref:hypothetical protein n=1 Tax=Candidatus Rariloculus sp. TaxID=3101265 RepID=UPI003D108EF1